MKKKSFSQQEQHSDGNEWMTTYSDMVTLLFTFFVLLFAISQVDVQKFNLLAASLSNRGATPEQIMEIGLRNDDEFDLEDPRVLLPEEFSVNPLQETYNTLSNHFAQSDVQDNMSVSLGEGYVFVRIENDILFDANSAQIRYQYYDLLRIIGNGIKKIENDIGMVRIDGHTAAVLEHEDYPVSDRELSSARANSVLKYLEDEAGIRGDKLAAFAFGKHRPVADNNTEGGRAQNRRIEILVTQTSEIDMQLEDIYEALQE